MRRGRFSLTPGGRGWLGVALAAVGLAVVPSCSAADPGTAEVADHAPAPVFEIDYDPRIVWQATGVDVDAGADLTFEASGEYVFHSAGHQTGPDGIADAVAFLGAWPANELTGLALIGKVGEAGTPFLIGSRARLSAPASGELFVMVNDDILEENSGTLHLTVSVGSPSAPEESGESGEPATAGAMPAVTPSSAQDGDLLALAQVGMQMTVPAGWQSGGISGESVLASFSGGSGLYPGLNVTLEDRGGRGLAQVRDDWLGLLSEATVNEQQERSIGGRAALYVDASWSSLLGQLRAMRLFVEHGERVIVITFADRAGGMDADSTAAYEACLDTVTFVAGDD